MSTCHYSGTHYTVRKREITLKEAVIFNLWFHGGNEYIHVRETVNKTYTAQLD